MKLCKETVYEGKQSFCRAGNGITQKSSTEVRAYIDFLHVIDNQQTLFELSHRLEPRAWRTAVVAALCQSDYAKKQSVSVHHLTLRTLLAATGGSHLRQGDAAKEDIFC